MDGFGKLLLADVHRCKKFFAEHFTSVAGVLSVVMRIIRFF